MTVRSFTHVTRNQDDFEEVSFELDLPWYDFSNPYLQFVRHSDGKWRYRNTGKELSDVHLLLVHAYLTTC